MSGRATSAEDVMREVAGGAILGVPLLYTQETWLHGRSVSPFVILAGVVVAFGANVALSYFGMGLSVLLSALLLVLLERVGRSVPVPRTSTAAGPRDLAPG
jgi:hypothetical protein